MPIWPSLAFLEAPALAPAQTPPGASRWSASWTTRQRRPACGTTSAARWPGTASTSAGRRARARCSACAAPTRCPSPPRSPMTALVRAGVLFPVPFIAVAAQALLAGLVQQYFQGHRCGRGRCRTGAGPTQFVAAMQPGDGSGVGSVVWLQSRGLAVLGDQLMTSQRGERQGFCSRRCPLVSVWGEQSPLTSY